MMISLSKAEKSFIQAGLKATPPSRADGRALFDWRSISLETGVAPLANGSARLSIGRGVTTEIVAAVKLEVETVQQDTDARDGGRIVCSVSCSPSAYPHLPSSSALDDLQSDLTSLLHQSLSHHSLHPNNLGILKNKKSWLLNLDALVLSDAGNVLDALYMAARAALWDTRVPRTRAIEYNTRRKARGGASAGDNNASNMDVDEEPQSALDTRHMPSATDFELPDYWDEGEVLDGRDRWPVAVTLHLEPPAYFLDATSQEEAASPLRLLLAFSFPSIGTPTLQTMRLIGPGELTPVRLKELVKAGEKHAREMFTALNAKLEEEDTRRNKKERKRFEQSR